MDYLQISAATPTSHTIIGDPDGPFHFSADIAGGNLNQLSPVPKVSLPDSTQFTLAGDNATKRFARSYSGKAALDAAFPNGSYTITAGSWSLPCPFGANDSYPAEIPQVTNGTWDGQGRLLINATTGATLTFNNFSNYSGGVGGTIIFNLYTVSGTTLGSRLVLAKSIALNGYPSDPALTSYTLPADFLQTGRTYYAELSFTRIVNLNLDYAIGLSSFLNVTGLMISTAASAAAPVITTQPASQTVTVGANVTLTVAASGNPVPGFQWRKDGVNIGGATFTSFSLNNVQLADAGSYTVVANNGAGVATSEVALLTVNALPVITTQPASQTIAFGNSVTFTVAASGTPTPVFQWKKGGIDISGATGSNYTIAAVSVGDAGSYAVTATNSAGAATSNPATLTVDLSNTAAPLITTQPESQTVIAGNQVTFTAAASGTPAPIFQWKKNGVNIPGATSSSYVISSAMSGDEAAYAVVATNAVGAATSDSALLSVIVAPGNLVVSFSIE